jgi:hypothetical protein
MSMESIGVFTRRESIGMNNSPWTLCSPNSRSKGCSVSSWAVFWLISSAEVVSKWVWTANYLDRGRCYRRKERHMAFERRKIRGSSRTGCTVRTAVLGEARDDIGCTQLRNRSG